MPKRTKILLVEDDLSVCEALGQALAVENYDVVRAANSREALCQFGQHQIDITLLDLNLGQEDGWETFQRLNELQPLRPIIVMSAQADRLAHALAPRADACFAKPLDLPILFKTLERLST